MVFANRLVSGPVRLTSTLSDMLLECSDSCETGAGITASAVFNRQGVTHALGLPELRPCSQPAEYLAAVVPWQRTCSQPGLGVFELFR